MTDCNGEFYLRLSETEFSLFFSHMAYIVQHVLQAACYRVLCKVAKKLVFLFLFSCLFGLFRLLVMQLYSEQLAVSDSSPARPVVISDVRGDVITVLRNMPACRKSRNLNVNKNVTMHCNKFIFSHSHYTYQYLSNKQNLFCICWSPSSFSLQLKMILLFKSIDADGSCK